MQRTERNVSIEEKVEALDEIIDLIVRLYDDPVRERFMQESRAAQLGHDAVNVLLNRDLLSRYSKIGYEIQTRLRQRQIIEPGGKFGQRELKHEQETKGEEG